LIAGARAVQIGTANFYAPDAAPRVIEGIRDYCARKQLHLSDLIGTLKVPATLDAPPNEYSPAG